MCRSPKLWIALGVAAVVIAVAAPSHSAVVPILLVAACPLMMLVMMGGMARGNRGSTPDNAEASEVARLRAEVAELRHRAGH